MTYLHIHDQGLPKRAPAERRRDVATAESVHDALRAHGVRAAAQAMEYQLVDMAVALRVLFEPSRRRAQAAASASASLQHAARPQPAHTPDLVAIAA
jgi:hypothetical protein